MTKPCHNFRDPAVYTAKAWGLKNGLVRKTPTGSCSFPQQVAYESCSDTVLKHWVGQRRESRAVASPDGEEEALGKECQYVHPPDHLMSFWCRRTKQLMKHVIPEQASPWRVLSPA